VTTPASTYNWDTVFATPATAVNAAIVAKRSSPSGFNVPASADAPAVTARFGDWQVCGGDGKNLRLTVPMSKLTIDSDSFDSAAATIEIKLEALPHTGLSSPPKGILKKLVPKTTTRDPVADPVVVVVSIISKPEMHLIQHAMFEEVFKKWINSNLAAFNHIFAVVNLNEDIDKNEQWAFTTPSYIEYAYLDGGTPKDSLFSVLCMTGGRSGSHLTAQVNPNAIPATCTGGYLLSPTRYLSDLLAPAMEHCYGGLTLDDIELASDSSSIGLKPDRRVPLPRIEHKGTPYTPVLTALNIKILGNTMEISSQTRTEVSPGITAITNATHWYGIRLASAGERQTLQYYETQPPVIVPMTEKSAGITITEIIMAIITAIGVVIAGILTEGAALIVAAVIIGALGGLAAAAPEIIRLVNTDRSPSIDALVLNATQPITWPGANKFALQVAGLNESLQLGGTLHFAFS